MALKDDLIKIVGKENVLDDAATREAYSQDNSFALPRKPVMVVKVKNVDQVQKIVQLANQTNTALVPVSSGPPHSRGDTVPTSSDAVVVDLSGMKKILSINRRNRIAIVEPGVTYGELQPALAKKGMMLSSSLAPRATKSVLTSLLEREPRLNPRYQWSYMDPLRCLEIVWGDGNKMWTGEAAGGPPDLKEQQKLEKWQVAGGGPAQTDFYRIAAASQGSMGIATWASVKCELLPTIHKLHFASSDKLEDLIDFTYRLARIRYGDEFCIMNNVQLAYALGKKPAEVDALKKEMPQWNVLVGIAGREILARERVDFQEKDISEIAQQFGLKFTSGIPGASSAEILKTITSPSRKPYWKDGYKGGSQDIFFVTTLDKTPQFVQTMYSVADAMGYPCTDIGVYIQPRHQGTCYHCEFTLPYNPDDEKETARMKELHQKASAELLNAGAYYSRPYGIWAQMAYNRDAQSTIVLKKIKKIFDPNHVMNPGKLCF